MRLDPTATAISPLADLPAAVGSGRGVIATDRDGLGIARVAAHRKGAGRMAELFRAQFGIEPPRAPRRASFGEVGLAGIAPDTWLAIRENAGNGIAHALQSSLGDCASVTDQSDAYVILRLTGPRVRETLAKLIPIDIHPRAFEVNAVVTTVCSYVSVMLWRLGDTARDEPSFEIWAGRSLAVSLYQAVSHAAAEFGFAREQAE